MAFHTLSLLHFPPLRYAPAFSTPAFSAPAFSELEVKHFDFNSLRIFLSKHYQYRIRFDKVTIKIKCYNWFYPTVYIHILYIAYWIVFGMTIDSEQDSWWSAAVNCVLAADENWCGRKMLPVLNVGEAVSGGRQASRVSHNSLMSNWKHCSSPTIAPTHTPTRGVWRKTDPTYTVTVVITSLLMLRAVVNDAVPLPYISAHVQHCFCFFRSETNFTAPDTRSASS